MCLRSRVRQFRSFSIAVTLEVCLNNLYSPNWQPSFGQLPLSVYQWQCVCVGVGGRGGEGGDTVEAYSNFSLTSVLYATDFRSLLWSECVSLQEAKSLICTFGYVISMGTS